MNIKKYVRLRKDINWEEHHTEKEKMLKQQFFDRVKAEAQEREKMQKENDIGKK